MRSKLLLTTAVLIALFSDPLPLYGQSATQSSADVVVLALGDTRSSRELRAERIVRTLSGDLARGNVRDVQMQIIQKTVEFGPVLVLAPDETARGAFHASCASYDLCEAIAAGRLRTAIIPHDTSWIRDYGPLIESSALGAASVTDASYYDVRADIARDRDLRKITSLRRLLAERALDDSSLAAPKDVGAELALLREYADILKSEAEHLQRPQDDRASFEIAQALLLESARRQPNYFRPVDAYLDGGNLLKLDDGRTCLSTRALFTRNRGREAQLETSLSKMYGCPDTLYLEPLPGPVIEHVDMFVLPVGGGNVLLADYGLHQEHIERAWPHLSTVQRELTFQASLAMDKNEGVLRSRGLNVTMVPALPPQVGSDGRIYYPVQLNALVRSNVAGLRQILLPRYSNYHEDVQDKAHATVAQAFGVTAQVVDVEATAAAEAQGAVHCLTITVPLDLTVFRSGQDVRQRQIWAMRKGLDNGLRRISRPTLLGTWSGERGEDGTDIELAFDEDTVAITVDEHKVDARYTAEKNDSFVWPLELLLDSGRRKAQAQVDWLTDRSFRLILSGNDPIVLEKFVRPEGVDPGDRVLQFGQTANGLLTDTDASDLEGALMQSWLFRGRAGDVVRASAESDAFDIEVFVVGPGLENVHDDDSGDGTNAALSFEVPEDGSYRVIAKSVYKSRGGEYSLRLDRGDSGLTADSRTAGRAVAVGATVQGILARAQLGAEPGQAWTLQGCTGRRVRVDLQSTAFDAMLTVSGSTLRVPVENDDVDDSLNSRVEFDCQAGGAYTIVVSSALGDEEGEYVLRVSQVQR